MICTVSGCSVAFAQAEPAPPGYVPPGHEPIPPEPSPLKWHIALNPRFVVLFGDRPAALPGLGWGAGVNVTRALVDIGSGMRFGLGADFAYQRSQHDAPNFINPVMTNEFVAHTSFAGLLVLDGIFSRVRPWLTAGGGFSVARFTAPPPQMNALAIDQTTVVPLVQVAAGVGVAVWRGFDLGLAGEVDVTFSTMSVGNPPRTPFAPGLFALRLDVGFRF